MKSIKLSSVETIAKSSTAVSDVITAKVLNNGEMQFFLRYFKDTKGGGRMHRMFINLTADDAVNFAAAISEAFVESQARRDSLALDDLHAKANIINETLYS